MTREINSTEKITLMTFFLSDYNNCKDFTPKKFKATDMFLYQLKINILRKY